MFGPMLLGGQTTEFHTYEYLPFLPIASYSTGFGFQATPFADVACETIIKRTESCWKEDLEEFFRTVRSHLASFNMPLVCLGACVGTRQTIVLIGDAKQAMGGGLLEHSSNFCFTSELQTKCRELFSSLKVSHLPYLFEYKNRKSTKLFYDMASLGLVFCKNWKSAKLELYHMASLELLLLWTITLLKTWFMPSYFYSFKKFHKREKII